MSIPLHHDIVQMTPLFVGVFVALALLPSISAAALNDEATTCIQANLDDTSLVQVKQTLRLNADRSDGASREQEAMLTSSRNGTMDEKSAAKLAARKMEYKKRLIEHESAAKQFAEDKAAGEAQLLKDKVTLKEVVAKGENATKATDLLARAAKAKWRETFHDLRGLDDPGRLKIQAEKDAERTLEKKVEKEWNIEFEKAKAKRTASEMESVEKTTNADFFMDMAEVQRLKADTKDSTDEEEVMSAFKQKVAQRTAAEKAEEAKITQQNYAADRAAAKEADALLAKVESQLVDEENSIAEEISDHWNGFAEPAQKEGANGGGHINIAPGSSEDADQQTGGADGKSVTLESLMSNFGQGDEAKSHGGGKGEKDKKDDNGDKGDEEDKGDKDD